MKTKSTYCQELSLALYLSSCISALVSLPFPDDSIVRTACELYRSSTKLFYKADGVGVNMPEAMQEPFLDPFLFYLLATAICLYFWTATTTMQEMSFLCIGIMTKELSILEGRYYGTGNLGQRKVTWNRGRAKARLLLEGNDLFCIHLT